MADSVIANASETDSGQLGTTWCSEYVVTQRRQCVSVIKEALFVCGEESAADIEHSLNLLKQTGPAPAQTGLILTH